jgi:hypothetical protein
VFAAAPPPLQEVINEDEPTRLDTPRTADIDKKSFLLILLLLIIL